MTAATQHAGWRPPRSIGIDRRQVWGLPATLFVGGVLILTTALKLSLYAHHPLAFDDTWTGMVASQSSLRGLIRECRADFAAPLGYVVAWLWARVAGLSDASLRLPETIFACATPLVAVFAARTVPRPVRLVWTVLLACWLPGMVFAQQARVYALVFLLATASTVAFVALLRRPRLATAFIWTGLSALLILAHYFALVLVGLQGLAYLVLRRDKALRTWPAALLFLSAFAPLADHAARLVSFSAPGISWIPLLTLGDLPPLIGFLTAGSVVLGFGVVVWIAACLVVLVISRHRRRPVIPTEPVHLLGVVALLAVLAAALCIGLGFLRPVLTARYLTPMVPGILLGIALFAAWFGRTWRIAPALIMIGMATFCLGILVRPPRLRVVFTIEPASRFLMAEGARRLVFLWDNPLTQDLDRGSLAQVGDFFFWRAGHPVATQALDWRRGADPNAMLLAKAQAPGSAILWLYDRRVAGTLAIAHPPSIARNDPNWLCQDFGGGKVGVIACHRRQAA